MVPDVRYEEFPPLHHSFNAFLYYNFPKLRLHSHTKVEEEKKEEGEKKGNI